MPRQRVVGLTEGLKQCAHVLVGQPDAGVLHADAQLHIVFLFVFEHGAGDDGAFAGELDRVADQVGEDLLESQRIAQQCQRRVAIHQAHQFQLFRMGGRGEDGQGVLQQVAQVEGHAVEHQLAGFDFREIQNLVDDTQQAVGGFFDGAQVIQLSRGHFAFLQQMGETENAIEGGANFVAHVGEEFRLDAAGLESFFTRQVQLDVLDFDGFQVLPDVFGGLVDAVLQFFLSILQGRGHAVDAGPQLVQFQAAQWWQAHFEVAVLELRHRQLYPADGRVDGAAHAQCQDRGQDQAGGDQQQAGEQAAVTAQ